ncbi:MULTISPECIES: mobile mystery protein A [Rhizobium/Agrobacterium group]|uniref:Transcriptional regulator n=2 Tax=Rhizobium/Agrobacterium group TaxID=227290 RepID=A0A1C7P7V6_9HYPH|nr:MULTISPECIES: mobile mystery protein A [Rhizobium/Agrobacterium group]ASK45095.1 transcriptional regulator [Agrobacterium radiobacter]MQB08216.1 mobile mystery protein A [Agrobacterium tumefaciens]NSY72561.1 mobile mystery protein A [Agrobacterium tumefaciens]NSZ72056.1 mobile mystery protein A [Agrobacterium tumefaciens]NTH16530.1 mobile mystery protein A [Rhizobium rhizogenes]
MKDDARKRARKRLDERLRGLQPAESFRAPPKGWVRALRDALGMTGSQLGSRMGIRPQTVEAIEKSEASGTIQLSTLRRAAEALDCTLVYALVPNTSLEATVDERARKIAMRELQRVAHTMRLEAQGTGDDDLEARVQAYIRDQLSERDLWSQK